jgi:hypothetical protein
MKMTKLSLFAAAIAAFGTSLAFADDAQLQNRLAAQRAQDAARNERETTVAVYAQARGLGRRENVVVEERSDVRLEQRSNARGQQIYLYAPAK